MKSLHVGLLAKYPQGIDSNLCFLVDFIQIIIDVVLLGYKPIIHGELGKCFLRNSFNPNFKITMRDGTKDPQCWIKAPLF